MLLVLIKIHIWKIRIWTMNKRVLGRTGLSVSEIAFGGVEIGTPYGIGVNSESDMLSEKDAIALIHAAIDSGINFFDTARMYGNSEAIMGKAFQGKRNEVIIATKCRHLRTENGSIPSGTELQNIIADSVQESLNMLRTSYLDVYMLHQSDLELLSNPEIAELFLSLKKEGLVRSIGASTYTIEETRMAIESGIWELVQIPFNLMNQAHAELFSAATAAGTGITVRSVLLRGLLTSRQQGWHPALKEVGAHIEIFKDIAAEFSIDLPALALKFALSFKEISSVLLGMDKMDYLHQSLLAANGPALDLEVRQRLREMAYPDPSFLNLHEWNKAGWL